MTIGHNIKFITEIIKPITKLVLKAVNSKVDDPKVNEYIKDNPAHSRKQKN